MFSKEILIATNSQDHLHFSEVVRLLESQDYRVIVYEADRIASGAEEFTLKIAVSGELKLSYRNELLDLSQIGAAWFRRPNQYGYYQDKIRGQSLIREYGMIQDAIWPLIAQDAWFNSPGSLNQANVKPLQLSAAASLGFLIPESVISNSWESVESLDYQRLVFKTLYPISFVSEEGDKGLPTTVLAHDNLPKTTVPYPGLWQSYAPKKREWRVTIVGDEVFSAAIYTEDYAKDDWRRHQYGPGVEFRAERFPDDQIEKCFALLNHFGLKFGAFDFVEKPDGAIVFLEVNANGQFKWLENRLGFPISQAIAQELVKIAKSRA